VYPINNNKKIHDCALTVVFVLSNAFVNMIGFSFRAHISSKEWDKVFKIFLNVPTCPYSSLLKLTIIVSIK